jgi:DNA-binding CsgD family transcriptional regulator
MKSQRHPPSPHEAGAHVIAGERPMSGTFTTVTAYASESVLITMNAVAPSSGAFVCMIEPGAGIVAEVTRLVDGALLRVTSSDGLESAFGVKDMCSYARRSEDCAVVLDPWPADKRSRVPYLREHSIPDGFSRALVVLFAHGPAIEGLAGLERRATEAPFSCADVASISALAPLLAMARGAQLAYDELRREVAILRAMGPPTGTVVVIDQDLRRIVWKRESASATSIAGLEPQIVPLTLQHLSGKSTTLSLTDRFGVVRARLRSVVDLEDGAAFGGRHVWAVQVTCDMQAVDAFDKLSVREAEVAKLLVEGYTHVNIGARCDLSPHTVRTYIRRIYTKVGVVSRADLVRELLRAPGRPEPR